MIGEIDANPLVNFGCNINPCLLFHLPHCAVNQCLSLVLFPFRKAPPASCLNDKYLRAVLVKDDRSTDRFVLEKFVGEERWINLEEGRSVFPKLSEKLLSLFFPV